MSILTFIAKDFSNVEVKDLNTTKKAITIVDFVAKSTEKAFLDFLENKYENFDALVGENACHIRVLMILDFYKNKKNQKNQMQDIIKKSQEIQQRIPSLKLQDIIPKKEMNFEDFCKTNNIFLEIPLEYLFLIEAYILCQSKELNSFEKSKPENLQKILPALTKKFSEEIVKNVQKSLSKRSVEYLQNLAKEMEFSLTSDLVFTNKKGIQGLPCYIVVQIILKHFLKEKYPVILKCTSNLDKSTKLVLFRQNNEKFIPDHINLESNPKDSLNQKLLEPTFVIERIFHNFLNKNLI